MHCVLCQNRTISSTMCTVTFINAFGFIIYVSVLRITYCSSLFLHSRTQSIIYLPIVLKRIFANKLIQHQIKVISYLKNCVSIFSSCETISVQQYEGFIQLFCQNLQIHRSKSRFHIPSCTLIFSESSSFKHRQIRNLCFLQTRNNLTILISIVKFSLKSSRNLCKFRLHGKYDRAFTFHV